jgi:tetratricopeptide (TPR) repeat protein
VQWDDYGNIVENPYLNPARPDVLYFWKKPYEGLYIPLTYTVWAALAGFSQGSGTHGDSGGLDPELFHLANLALHLLSVLVVFAILWKLVRSDWGACAGALLFALHPVQVEPVAWITGMKDVLAGFLSLVAVWQYLGYSTATSSSAKVTDESAKASAEKGDTLNPGQKGYHYVLATLAFLLALLAKPTAAVVPLAAWLLDYWILRRSVSRRTLVLLGWTVLAVPFIAFAKLTQPDTAMKFIAPVWARPLVAGDALAFYLYKLVWPLWLGPDYGRSPEWVLQQRWIFVSWIVPCGLAVLIWLRKEWRPWLVASLGVFFVGVLPASGLIPFVFQSISTVADRYLYFSMLGPALAVAWLLSQYHGRLVVVGCVLMLGLLGVRTASQTQVWRDTMTLFTQASAVNPQSWTAHYNVGMALVGQGNLEEGIGHYRRALQIDPESARTQNELGIALARQGKVSEAIESYQQALRLLPGFALPHYNLGNLLKGQGKLTEALRHYQEAVRIDPDFLAAHNNLAVALVEGGNSEEAIQHFRRVLEINPLDSGAYYNLGNALAERGELEEAIKHYRRALQINPAYAEAQKVLGRISVQQGKLEEAIQQFRRSLEIDPKDADAHNSLGITLVMRGDVEEGIRHFRQAAQIDPDYAKAHHNLGNALAGQGKVKEAIDQFRQALRIEPKFAEAHESLGRALAAQGKREEAAKHIEEALRILRSQAASRPPSRSVP